MRASCKPILLALTNIVSGSGSKALTCGVQTLDAEQHICPCEGSDLGRALYR